MRNNQFANVCLALIVVLLGMIALRHDATPAYAAEAERFSFEVVPVEEANFIARVNRETQIGWEPVAAPMWEAVFPPQGFVIFRKPK